MTDDFPIGRGCQKSMFVGTASTTIKLAANSQYSATLSEGGL